MNNIVAHESIFEPVIRSDHNQSVNLSSTTNTQCDTGNTIRLLHYCSTHWNPPAYLTRLNCNHVVELHSPLRCHSDVINHEHPCYIYEPSGKLVDLTPWVLSDGSSYQVDTGSTEIENFHINVCNEAHNSCGPNVSACFTDKQHGLIESGYNNLTSIKYDAKERAVLLTSLGHFKEQCEGSRMKTVIRFICKDKIVTKAGPKLMRSSACENIIEWPTVRACPVSEVKSPITDCRIKFDPLGIDIDIKKITNNRTVVQVPNIKIGDKNKTMLLGICQGLPRAAACEGRSTATTTACLIDANIDNSTAKTANNSMIVGSSPKSQIRLADEHIYLESFAYNKTCSERVRDGFNVTQQLGTRVEFYCSPKSQDAPTFLGFDDCVYVFEWGSPLMCLETFAMPAPNSQSTTETNSTRKSTRIEDAIVKPHVEIKDVFREDSRKKARVEKASTQGPSIESSPEPIMKSTKEANNKPPRMGNGHRFLMISLIIVSFGAFIVIIFVMDKKTRLRITLRQARQAFQPNQQPYSRVVNDLDL